MKSEQQQLNVHLWKPNLKTLVSVPTLICCWVQTTSRWPPVADGLSASDPPVTTSVSDSGRRLRSTMNVATTGAPCFRRISFAAHSHQCSTTTSPIPFNSPLSLVNFFHFLQFTASSPFSCRIRVWQYFYITSFYFVIHAFFHEIILVFYWNISISCQPALLYYCNYGHPME